MITAIKHEFCLSIIINNISLKTKITKGTNNIGICEISVSQNINPSIYTVTVDDAFFTE